MFISDSLSKLIGSYSQNNDKTKITDTKASLKDIKIGDEVKVTITKINDDSINVRMPNGEEISIAGKLPSDAKEGSILNIRVLSNREGMPLEAEILSCEKNLEEKIQDLKLVLKDLGISPSKENLETVNDMARNGIEINKENIAKMFDIIDGMNIKKENAIFMVKNDIEVTSESSRAFNNMITNSDFLETNLKVLIDTLTSAINDLNENINTNLESADASSISMLKGENLTKIFNVENPEMTNTKDIEVNVKPVDNIITANNEEDTSQTMVNPSTNKIETNENVIKTTLSNDISTRIIDKTVDNSNETHKNLGNINVSNAEEAVDIANSEQTIENKELIPNKYTDFEFGVEEPEVIETPNEEVKEGNKVTLTKEEIIVTPNEENVILKEDALKSDNKVTTENKNIQNNSIENEEENLKEQVKIQNIDIDKTIEENDPLTKKEKLSHLRDEVVGIFREVKGTKELAEDISLKRIFKSFKDVIQDIENNKEIFSKETAEKISKETTHMKENLELISDLNKYNTVVHIPLQINDNKSMAELYVFNGDKNNTKRKINENNATMFLSLGTANMGQVESYIKVVNKTIECNFMTENDIGTSFIIENKAHLSDLLAAYGYTLIKANAETYTGKTLNIFEAIEKNKKDEKQKGFDARA
ncbi:MAG: hypothetical protein MJ245_00090 [Clostridia bacterium]|nr:hypothetical protein [Clostridia bacterium]